MKRPGLLYGALRVGLFAVVFTVLMLAGLDWWLSAPIAAIVGLCVAYVFFGRLRDAAAAEFRARREKPPVDDDENAEDALPAPHAPASAPSEGDRGSETQPERESGDGRQP